MSSEQACQFEEALVAFNTMLEQGSSPLFAQSIREQQLVKAQLGHGADRVKDQLSLRAMQNRMISPDQVSSTLSGLHQGEFVNLHRVRTTFPELRYNSMPSALGHVFLVYHEDKLCYLNFLKYRSETEHLMQCSKRWPRGRFISDTKVGHDAVKILGDSTADSSVDIALINITDFQWRVYACLLGVVYGQTTSYDRLAFAANASAASRAVGSAMAANPVLWFLPCHRVLRQNGSIGRFSGGTGMKEALLLRESSTA